jgi:hypothetical protein
MTTQTTYNERLAPNSPGTLQGMDFAVDTGICETASPGIPFGRAVSQGTLSDQGVVLGGTLAGFRGISVKSTALGAEHDAYLPPDNVNVMKEGTVWVEPASAVVVNGQVYFNATTGLFDDSASGNIGPIKGARWKTSCGVGGRAVVELSGYLRSDA